MSNFLANIQKLKREVNSIKKTEKNEDEIDTEINYKDTKFKKMKSEFDELKDYKEENYVLKDTIIQLQNEIRCSKDIKFIDNLKEEINNLNDGIDFWKGDSGDMENKFNLERNNHGKTKLKLKNLSNYCDDLKINHATEIDDLKEKLEKTNKKYNTLIVNIKKFFE